MTDTKMIAFEVELELTGDCAFTVRFMGNTLGTVFQCLDKRWGTSLDDDTYLVRAQAVDYVVMRAVLRGAVR